MKSGAVEPAYVCGNHATPRHVDFVGSTRLFPIIWFDLEHFDLPTETLAVVAMVARSHGMTAIARFKALNYERVQQVLETGVEGILCAMVESPEEARDIVRWSKFNNPNPLPGEVTGQRGWNGGGIDARYGTLPAADYVRRQNNEIAIICQIETQESLARVDEIASTPGVEALFFGPGDFAHRLGFVGQLSHPKVTEAMRSVARACSRQGKWWGTLGIGPDHYRQVRELGAQLICPGGDARVMINGIRELAKTFQPPQGRDKA